MWERAPWIYWMSSIKFLILYPSAQRHRRWDNQENLAGFVPAIRMEQRSQEPLRPIRAFSGGRTGWLKQIVAPQHDGQDIHFLAAQGLNPAHGLESDAKQQAFLQGLAGASGLMESELLEAGSGTNDLVMRDILFAFLAAQIFLNTVFFVIVAMKSLPKQGKLMCPAFHVM